MSTGNMKLDLLLSEIVSDETSGKTSLHCRFPTLSDKDIDDLYKLISCANKDANCEKASLVATSPPSFRIKAKATKATVETLIANANKSILITGYSLSEYFSTTVDRIINKSQKGVFVKFFVNHIEDQNSFDRICRYKGRFLKIYNYPKHEDKMAALHAKVITVDQYETLITSANLSYHGQEGNIELGTHIISSDIARQVDDFFTQLIFAKVFEEM